MIAYRKRCSAGEGRVSGPRQGLEGIHSQRHRQLRHRRAPRRPYRSILLQAGGVRTTPRSSEGSNETPGSANDHHRIVPSGKASHGKLLGVLSSEAKLLACSPPYFFVCGHWLMLIFLSTFPTRRVHLFIKTAAVRKLRRQFKSGALSAEEYERAIDQQISYAIGIQASVKHVVGGH